MSRNVLALVAVTLVLAAPASAAYAAADLASASPAPGSEIAELPDEIELRFTQDLSAADVELDGDQVESEVDGNLIRVSASGLDEGEHELSWRVESEVDGVETSGSYTFEIVSEEDTSPPEVDPAERAERVEQLGDDNRTEVLLWTALAVAAGAVLGLIFFFFRSTIPGLPATGLSGGLPPPGDSPPEHHEEGDSDH